MYLLLRKLATQNQGEHESFQPKTIKISTIFQTFNKTFNYLKMIDKDEDQTAQIEVNIFRLCDI